MIYKSVESFLPQPPEMRQYWKQLGDWGPRGKVFEHKTMPLRVIITIPDDEGFIAYCDGQEWIHVSVSHKDRLPSYQEMKEIKRVFIGDERMAISIWPKARVHVNIAKNCLHLWHRADADPCPTFGEEGTI